MSRSAFEKSGKYRNFPCAQDYDLWLRMSERGFKFYILNEKLLKYRIHSKSVTNTRCFKQAMTVEYIKSLYKERKKKGKDSYSLDNYNNYLKKMHLFDEKYLSKCMYYKEKKEKNDLMKTKSKTKYILGVIGIILRCTYYRKMYFVNLKTLIKYKSL